MKKLFSTRYSAGSFNTSLFILRVALGVLLAHHGYDKIQHFSTFEAQFINFLGLGTKVSLCLAIFAEFFCSILIVLGLFTRLACIPCIILMCVILFKVLDADVFGKGEVAALYLAGFLALLFSGPGKVSVDSMISK